MASSNDSVPTPVPFPHPESIQPLQQTPSSNPNPNSPTARRSRTSTNASTTSAASRLRTASIKFMEASPPPGMWAATGSVTSKAPTLSDIRRGSFSASGWNEESQRYRVETQASQGEEEGRSLQRQASGTQSGDEQGKIRPGLGKTARQYSSDALKARGGEPFPAVTEEGASSYPTQENPLEETISQSQSSTDDPENDELEHGSTVKEKNKEPEPDKPRMGERKLTYGYRPPPKVPWATSTVIALKAFWKWFLTIPGFLITVYGLNVVAWGGMLFLLLCNAAPAMCHPSCNDIQSPRRIWIEIDSQILNALFCVTGFGLAPWRFRDLYWWGFWRLGGSKHRQTGIRRLAGIHRGWYRLPGSNNLPETASAATVSPDDPAVPIPHTAIPDPPPTGVRAEPTKGWKMGFVVWMNVWNTFFQIILCFYMWHYNRYDRPSWATGLFVALGCTVAGLGGIMMFVEGKAVKKVEGVPILESDEKKPTDIEAEAASKAPNP